jgi:hypothetical protein
MFIKICAQENSLYEGGGAMVTYLICECGSEEFKSSHL